MKTTQEMIAVMQAYVDGKEIEFLQKCNKIKVYKSTDYPSWNWFKFDYQVKETPEYVPFTFEDAPEYVPFTFEDAEFLIGKVVKHKRDNWVVAITYCYKNETQIGTFEDLLCNFTFLDGSPCGKLKQ